MFVLQKSFLSSFDDCFYFGHDFSFSTLSPFFFIYIQMLFHSVYVCVFERERDRERMVKIFNILFITPYNTKEIMLPKW